MRSMVPVLFALLAAASGCADMEAVRKNIDYGKVLIYSHENDFPTWTNTTQRSITVTGAPLNGPDLSAFNRTVPDPFGTPSVAAGTSFSITVRFGPQEKKRYWAVVTPQPNTGAATPWTADRIDLEGEGVFQLQQGDFGVGGGTIQHPDGSFIDAALDFGDVLIGSSSTRTLKLINKGSNPLALTAQFSILTDWSMSMATGGAATTSVTIPASSEVTVIITFKPSAIGESKNAILFFEAGMKSTGGTSLKGRGRQGG